MSDIKIIFLYRYFGTCKVIECCFVFVLGGCLISKFDYLTYIYMIGPKHMNTFLCKDFHQVSIMLHIITNMHNFMSNKLVTFTAFVMGYSGHNSYLLVSPVEPLHFILMLAQVVLCKVMHKNNIPYCNISPSLFVLYIIPGCHKIVFSHTTQMFHEQIN